MPEAREESRTGCGANPHRHHEVPLGRQGRENVALEVGQTETQQGICIAELALRVVKGTPSADGERTELIKSAAVGIGHLLSKVDRIVGTLLFSRSFSRVFVESLIH